MVEVPKPFLKRKKGAGILQEHNSLSIIRFLPTHTPCFPPYQKHTLIPSLTVQLDSREETTVTPLIISPCLTDEPWRKAILGNSNSHWLQTIYFLFLPSAAVLGQIPPNHFI